MVVMVSAGGSMVIDSACVSVCGGLSLSVTCTVKLEVPAAVGVPLIWPVEALIDSPEGSVPEETDQVYGVVPPVALTV